MKFHWKLLILLLSIGVIPVLVLRTFGVRHLYSIKRELVSHVFKCRQMDAQMRMQAVLAGYSAVLQEKLEQADKVLRIQALEVQRLLTCKPLSAAAGRSFYIQTRNAPAADSVNRQFFRLPPGVKKEAVAADIARLSAMTPIYRQLSGPVFVRHQTLLASGLLAVYPAIAMPPDAWQPGHQSWYRQALAEPLHPSYEEAPDPASGQMGITESLAIRGPGEGPAGVTAVVISAARLFEKQRVLDRVPPQTRVFLVRCFRNPPRIDRGLKIIAEQGDLKSRRRISGPGSSQRWLTSADIRGLADLQRRLQSYAGGLRRMPYEGRDSLWAGRLIFHPYALVLVMPYAVVKKAAQQSEAFVQALITRQSFFSLYLLVVVSLAAICAALIFSRTVTRPLKILMQGIRQRAAGRLDTRVKLDSRDEFGDLARVFNATGPLLEEHFRLENSLAMAVEVQRNLLPSSDPKVPGLDIAGTSIYCQLVGGDYYDYLIIGEHREGKVGIVIGDVTGHGIPAALLMASVRALLHERTGFPGCIHCDLPDINRQLYYDVGDSGRFMTLFYAEFDTRAKSVHWARAGHDPVIIYNPREDSFDVLGGEGTVLGVFENMEYKEYRRDVKPGEIFIFGTDGIWETRNAKDELFGKERLRAIIRSQAAKPAEGIRDAVLEAVQAYRGDAAQEDDITLVVVKAAM